MITSQFHAFLTHLGAPFRSLIEPKQLPSKTIDRYSTWKTTLLHLLFPGQDGSIVRALNRGSIIRRHFPSIHRGASTRRSIDALTDAVDNKQMLSLGWAWRPREGWSRCQNLEQGQGKEERHQPGQPGQPVGRGVVRDPTTKFPAPWGAWREARRPTILQENK